MTERETVIDKLRLTYEGLFSVQDLYKLIDSYFEDRNYDKREIKNYETVKPEGKFIELEMEPWKKYTDYYRNIIHLRILMDNIKEVEIEKEGHKIRVNQGKVQIIFDGYIETDYEHKWESNAMFFFLRTLYNKYFYLPYTMRYTGSCKADIQALQNQIKDLLNVYRKR
ncbi:hypothetical protein H6504_00260 [Candidatus Woesearchaeota archaeon]|nr:hypothetical protein [Candidatus Woesearchaeota archaeon]